MATNAPRSTGDSVPATQSLPVLADSKPADARRRRRRAARPARPVRRGRHRAGPARARGRPVRRRRRGRVGALHGQGPLQGGAARPRHPGRAQRDAPRSATRSRTRSATRSSSSRHGSARRSGSRRRTTRRSSSAAVALAPAARREGARRGVRRGHRGRVRRARQPRPPPVASVVGEIVPARRVVRLRGQVRRGRLGHHRPGPHPGRDRCPRPGRSPSTPSSPPSAREWPASTSSCARTARWS